MKTDPEEAIEAVVERAMAEMRVLLAKGRVINYDRLGQILGSADPMSRLVENLFSPLKTSGLLLSEMYLQAI